MARLSKTKKENLEKKIRQILKAESRGVGTRSLTSYVKHAGAPGEHSYHKGRRCWVPDFHVETFQEVTQGHVRAACERMADVEDGGRSHRSSWVYVSPAERKKQAAKKKDREDREAFVWRVLEAAGIPEKHGAPDYGGGVSLTVEGLKTLIKAASRGKLDTAAILNMEERDLG